MNTHPLQASDPFLAAYSAKALPVDVALGKIDSLDINGAYEFAVPLWHRLLNCGFRLPASAGTDVFLNRLRGRLPGGDRAYVRLDGAFSYDAWVKGLKAGRSFVTNGPMLEFTATASSSATRSCWPHRASSGTSQGRRGGAAFKTRSASQRCRRRTRLG